MFNFFFKKDGTASTIFGYYFLLTNETGMAPEIMPGEVVIGREINHSDLKADDVVIAKISDRITIIRITEVTQGIAGNSFLVKYDAAVSEAPVAISGDSIIAKAEIRSAPLGSVLRFATSVPGILIAVIIPLTIIIIYQIARFAGQSDDDSSGSETKKIDTSDIDDLLKQRDEENPSAAVFKPNISEFIPPKVPAEKKITVDKSGKADVVEIKKPEISEVRRAAVNTYRKYTPEPAVTRVQPSPVNPLNNTPPQNVTRIEDLVPTMPVSEAESEIYEIPKKYSAVIPGSIAALQTQASAPLKREIDSPKTYFNVRTADTSSKPANVPEDGPVVPQTAIPKNAVIPKEKIAPAGRKNTGKTIDELMKIIDAESTKLKK